MRALFRVLALVAAIALLGYGLVASSWDMLSGQGAVSYDGDSIWMLSVYASCIPIGYLLFSLIPRQTIGWRRNACKIAAVLVVGFIVVSLQLLRQQFVIAPALASRPVESPEGPVLNPRTIAAEVRTQRGRVFDRRGRELAGRQVTPDGRVRRTYPVPEASYLVGYYTANSPFNRGNSGLESSYDNYLSGRAGNPVENARSRLLRQALVGSDLYLTLDAELQRLAQRLLGGRRGAIIAMNPKTGEILAMASSPAYNAADLAYNPDAAASAEEARLQRSWRELTGDTQAARLLNRATQGLYSPGSTFKTVTAAAALDTGVADPEKVYEDDGTFAVGGFVVQDPNRPDKSKTRWTFTEAYQYSLNAVFAQVGLEVGSAGMREYGRRFGYEREVPFDLPVRVSQLESTPGFLSDQVALANTAYGQGQLLTTPLQVLLTTATVADGGTMPSPYLVNEVRTPGGRVVVRNRPGALGEAVVSPEVARELTRLMVTAVESGSGRSARIEGLSVAGKTGTAQLGAGRNPHSWFTAFAPAENPRVAVVVLIEHGGEGYR
ncbi:MAG: penicillin-binding protein 2, partial [Chloroflexota bacterium]|nr:penicillin-binding protein 2 [Chloroflexota bacterium]